MADEAVGVNVEEASSGGMASAEAAARLKDLPEDFSEASEDAKDAVNKDPKIQIEGWGNFEETHEYHMRNVSYHAENLGENIEGAAYEAAVADLEAAEQIDGSVDAPQVK